MHLTIVLVDMPDPEWVAMITAVHEVSATHAYRDIFSTPFPREEAHGRWSRFRGTAAVALHEGLPVGFAAWHDDRLDALYVLPQAAGAGIGDALISQATDARRLWVLQANVSAQKFYTRRGWCASGLERPTAAAADIRELEFVRD